MQHPEKTLLGVSFLFAITHNDAEASREICPCIPRYQDEDQCGLLPFIKMKISVGYYHLVSTRQRPDGFMTFLVPLNNHTNLLILLMMGLSISSRLVPSLFCPPPHFLPLSLPLRPIFCLRSSDNSVAAYAQCPHVFNSALAPAFPYWDLVIRMPQVAFCGRGAGQPARSAQTVMYMLCDR